MDVQILTLCDFAEDFFLVRSVDTLPAILHARELFQGAADA